MLLSERVHNPRLMDRRQAMRLGTGTLAVAALAALAGDAMAELIEEQRIAHGQMRLTVRHEGRRPYEALAEIEIYRRADGTARLVLTSMQDESVPDVLLPAWSTELLLNGLEALAAA